MHSSLCLCKFSISLLAIIAHSAVRSSTQTLFIDTSTMIGTTKLIFRGTPYLAIITSDHAFRKTRVSFLSIPQLQYLSPNSFYYRSMKCLGMFFVRPKGSKLFKRRILRHITTLQLYCVFILAIKLCLLLRSLLVFGQGSNKFGYRFFLKVNKQQH